METKPADPQADRHAVSVAGRTFALTASAGFEAAHFLASKPEGHAYRGVHGHSFRIEATVAGRVAAGEAWVEDFAVLKAALAQVAARLDHTLLNDVPGLGAPTLERLCVWIAEALGSEVRGLARVAVCRPSLDERCELVLSPIP
jgi:6-pyruvoyltetrahydropterin/6-carboxytetrahydropterin synthase